MHDFGRDKASRRRHVGFFVGKTIKASLIWSSFQFAKKLAKVREDDAVVGQSNNLNHTTNS